MTLFAVRLRDNGKVGSACAVWLLPRTKCDVRRIALSYVEHNHRSGGSRPWRSNTALVAELAEVLVAHPGGLRRWSVMRAMRRKWEGAQQEVSLKFEDEVERNFCHFSEDDDLAKPADHHAKDALFFRPRDKAGEVWAAYPDRVRAWLARNAEEKCLRQGGAC